MHRLLSRFRLKISPTLIRIDHKAGHGFNKATTKLVKEQADIYAFIMYNLGMKMKYRHKYLNGYFCHFIII